MNKKQTKQLPQTKNTTDKEILLKTKSCHRQKLSARNNIAIDKKHKRKLPQTKNTTDKKKYN